MPRPVFARLHLVALIITAALCPFWAAGIASGQEESLAPGINRHYEDPDYARWVEIFESPGREVYDQRETILSALALAPGMDVADVGAGTGLFTLLFAEAVGPDGRVYAVDIAENFVEAIDARARSAGMRNVTTILGGERTANLPASSVDLVFLCDTYHHFEYPQAMLQSLRDALRPDGRLVVIDFRKDPGTSSSWVMGHVRADEGTVIEEIADAGFELMDRSERLVSNYFLIFGRP